VNLLAKGTTRGEETGFGQSLGRAPEPPAAVLHFDESGRDFGRCNDAPSLAPAPRLRATHPDSSAANQSAKRPPDIGTQNNFIGGVAREWW
jgi:hypothetical protein